MLPRPPSRRLPSTWLTRISRWRIAKTAPLSRSSIERPDRLCSSAAIIGRPSRAAPAPGIPDRASPTGARGSARSATVAPPADRDELDQRDGRHGKLELELHPPSCRSDRVHLLDSFEVVSRAEARPSGVVRPLGPAQSLPGPGDVRVAGVHPVVAERVASRSEPRDAEGDGATERPDRGAPRLVDCPVPDGDRDAAVRIAGRPGLDQGASAVARELAGQLVLAEPFEHGDRPETGLAEVADREQAEPAVEERRCVATFDEVVRCDPVRERVEPAGRRPHAACDERRSPGAVVDGSAVTGADAPFRPPQRQIGTPEAGGDRPEVERRKAVGVGGDEVDAVSYTHLTLPTKRIV